MDERTGPMDEWTGPMENYYIYNTHMYCMYSREPVGQGYFLKMLKSAKDLLQSCSVISQS